MGGGRKLDAWSPTARPLVQPFRTFAELVRNIPQLQLPITNYPASIKTDIAIMAFAMTNVRAPFATGRAAAPSLRVRSLRASPVVSRRSFVVRADVGPRRQCPECLHGVWGPLVALPAVL